MHTPPFLRLASRIAYKNPWMVLREDIIRRGDKEEPYSVVERPDSVIVIPWTEQRRTVLLKQYRHPTQEFSWEFPGGAMKGNETPEEAARRELGEETGIIANTVTMIGCFHPIPALASQTTTVYLATLRDTVLRDSLSGQYVDDIVDHQIVQSNELKEMVCSGKITDGLTLTAMEFLHLSGRL